MFPEGRILDFVIVGVIALIVVGPKDLPVLMRKVGQFVAKMRAMAVEFRASFDEMARQSELDDLRREVEAMRKGEPLKAAVGLGADSETARVFEDIHAGLRGDEPPSHPAMDYQYPAGSEPAPSDATSAPPEPPEPGTRESAKLEPVTPKAPS